MQSQNRPSEPEAEKKDGFVMLPRWLFESELLSGKEKFFCLTLAYHRNKHTHLCCPGKPTICREATISEDTYYSIRGRLKRIGLIDYEESVGGRKQNLKFILRWLDGSKEERAKLKAILKGKKPPEKDIGLDTINPPKRTSVNPPKRTSVNPPKRTSLTIKNYNKKKDNNKEIQQQQKPAVAVPSFSPFSQEATLINRIAKLGIPQKKAKTLLVRYGKSAVRNQLDWLTRRNLKNPAGAFITALKENWPEPVRSEGEEQDNIFTRATVLFKREGDCGELRKLLSELDPDYKEKFEEFERDQQYEGLES